MVVLIIFGHTDLFVRDESIETGRHLSYVKAPHPLGVERGGEGRGTTTPNESVSEGIESRNQINRIQRKKRGDAYATVAIS